MAALRTFTEDAPELSNAAVEKMIPVSPVFEKALSWSRMVNEEIEKLPREEIKPFDGVYETFEKIHENCDIAVVSSANPEAVRQEWERFGLLEMVDRVYTQEAGTKSACIRKILDDGYGVSDVLMVGDAPGDLGAARENSVFFYPILVRHEVESWSELREKGLFRFLLDDYEEYGKEKVLNFEKNLK